MYKIALIGSFNFTPEQQRRLKVAGEIISEASPASAEEWLAAASGADIIVSDGDYLLENLDKLDNVFVTYPYIELGSFDSKQLAERGVYVANTQGSNRDSIVEWVTFMMIALFRKFPACLNATDALAFERTESLVGKSALIVGKGNIGSRIGEVCGLLGMSVDYFGRGDDLLAKSEQKDVIINCLNSNPTSRNLLDANFFSEVTSKPYFVSFVRPYTYDVDGLVEAVKAGTIRGAAIDCDPEASYDTTNEFYKKLVGQPNVLVTPHVAFATTAAGRNGAETLVANVEAYAAGNPQNIVEK